MGKTNIIFFFIALILSPLIVYFSMLIPKTFYSKQDQLKVECGLPTPFVLQDQSYQDPPFPWEKSCVSSFMDTPTKILWFYLFLDLVLVVGLQFALLICFKRAIQKNIFR